MTTYKLKLNNLKLKLGSLLAQKKALHSKVVCKEYDKFLEAAGEVLIGRGNPSEIRLTLIDLERALKQEGLYKILKAEFSLIKKSFLASPGRLQSADEDDDTTYSEHKRPIRTTTAVISRQSYVKDTESEKSTPTYIPVALSELRNLHKAVGDLYHHLDVHKPDVFSSRHLTKAKHKPSSEEEDFHSIHQRIKQFEGELVRQKASQHTEILRLVEENRNFKKEIQDLQKQNERFKSIHPIAHKAMDKTVEKIEQHYMTQKRGIEGKIIEIETELHSSLEKTMKEKEDLEHMMTEGLGKLRTAITILHQRIGAKEMSHSPESNSKSEIRQLGIENMLRKVTDIGEDVLVLQRRNKELSRMIKELESESRELKTLLKDINIEINKTHEAILSLEQHRKGIIKLPPVNSKTSLQDRDSAKDKLRDIEEQIQHYQQVLNEDNSMKRSRDELKPLRSRINKIYDELIQIVDPADIPGSSYQKNFEMFLVKAGRERSDDVNQLLRKLTRIDNICQHLLFQYNKYKL